MKFIICYYMKFKFNLGFYFFICYIWQLIDIFVKKKKKGIIPNTTRLLYIWDMQHLEPINTKKHCLSEIEV